MSRRVHGWLHDEQGDRSLARLLLVYTVPFTGLVILMDAITPVAVPGEAYALLAGLLTGEIAWAGGSRIARYIGPQIAGVAQGIAAKVSPGTTTVSVTPGVPAAPADPTEIAAGVDEPHRWRDGDPEEGLA